MWKKWTAHIIRIPPLSRQVCGFFDGSAYALARGLGLVAIRRRLGGVRRRGGEVDRLSGLSGRLGVSPVHCVQGKGWERLG